VHASGADGVRGALTVSVDAAYAGGQIDIAWPLLTTAAPVLSGSCTATPLWNAARARLTISVSGEPCTMRVVASQ